MISGLMYGREPIRSTLPEYDNTVDDCGMQYTTALQEGMLKEFLRMCKVVQPEFGQCAPCLHFFCKQSFHRRASNADIAAHCGLTRVGEHKCLNAAEEPGCLRRAVGGAVRASLGV